MCTTPLFAFGFVAVAALLAFPATALAQTSTINIPLYVETDEPAIDGVWTTAGEWTKASKDFMNYTDGTQLVIRAMHTDDFVFVLLEMPHDNVVDGHAAVCFDTLSDGGPYLMPDDYCFVQGTTLREYHGDGRTNLMGEAPLMGSVEAARGLSGSNSPYNSGSDHVSYEFKVPVEYLGSSTEYGFFVGFDTRGQDDNYTYNYSWPDSSTASHLRTTPPRGWAVVSLSPYTDVPEFSYVLLATAAVIGIAAAAHRAKLVPLE